MDRNLKKYNVKVTPRSSRNKVILVSPNELKVSLTTPPVDGRANEALKEVLADYFKVKKYDVEIVSGDCSRKKIVSIHQHEKSTKEMK